MINYSHPFFILLRSYGQKLGILRPCVRFVRRIFNLSYENGFDKEMMALISQNDIVWDVGANVGFFTKKFSEKVGQGGVVFAFEPSHKTFSTLKKNCENLKNVTCLNLGLSNKSGKLNFRDSGIDNDPTNGLVESAGLNTVVVEVTKGDDLIQQGTVTVPSAVKIDVEGFELDVVQGMHHIINNPALKKIFVEVHFLEMAKRGLKNGSTEMVKLISDSGFIIKWTDPSHFIALRK